ncbi:MAG: hypothetical protein A2756_05350 [Candidatus Ryanbacteria bacterium RIFCSPHIGHO2_01_FULL_48_27]|uniref:Uncharacterized protein n=1 Tax=Candidatus Ryanbacteria bacterium RIFCSPHIGHO2_01_FULL_48_27 TaxID=1802115 RepID=A0A1G2G1F3_9BACT|nr:MAG: hypothetical protein A2756_05350 [Candidatus Ryanbacteria bacterium RIFCSPHIGHO2_01_FULL_48_27]
MGAANSIFNGAVAYFNKPLMLEILTAIGESRGRDMTNMQDFVNSSAYEMSMIGASAFMVAITLFFIWQLYQRRAYFNANHQL